jgi:hypothetical protein
MTEKNLTFNVQSRADAGAGFAKTAAEVRALAATVDEANSKIISSQLRAAAAQEALNKVMGNSKSSVADLARAHATLIDAQSRVTTETNRAAEATKKAAAEADKAGESAKKYQGNLRLLVDAALLLGPALVPIGAVAAGAFAGLVPVVGTAVLAFKQLTDSWKEGTLQGSVLGKQVTIFQNELETLQHVAANGIAPGLNQAMKDIEPLFPQINRDISLMASQMGQIVSHVAPGLVTMFIQLQPLFQTFGDEVVKASVKFQQWATSGQGIKNFVAYVQTNLPSVETTLGNLAITVAHLIQGFAPFGTTSLTGVRLLTDAINHIPVGILQIAVPLLAGLAVGVRAFQGANNVAIGIGKFASTLEASGGAASKAAPFVSGLSKVMGSLGIVGAAAGVGLGLLSLAMGRNAQAAQEQQKRVNDLTQALKDGNVQQALSTQLIDSGAVKAGQQYGLTLHDLLGAVNQQKAAQDKYNNAVAGAEDKLHALAAATRLADAVGSANGQTVGQLETEYIKTHKSLDGFKQSVQDSTRALSDARAKVAEYAKAQGDEALGTAITTGAAAKQAKALGLTEDAYIAAKLATDKNNAAQKQAHDAMVYAGDAAGLLKEKLDQLNGVQLTAFQSEIQFHTALLGVTTALQANGRTLDLNKQAGIDNRSAVLQAIQTAKDNAVAISGETAGTKANTDVYRKNIAAILDRIAKANGDKTATDRQRDAVYQLVLQLSGYNRLPIPVKHAKVDGSQIPPAILKAQDSIDSLHGKTVPVTIQWSGPGGAPGPAAAGFFGKAAGGYITGPGTKTSDSIPILASHGEFMMKADAVSKYGLGFMQNINAMKFANGGPIILQLPSGLAQRLDSIENSLHPVWNIASSSGGAGGLSSPGSFSGSQLQWVFAAENATGTPASWTAPILRRIMFESGGNPNAINNWDSNAAAGDPSRGLMQTIMSTFLAYHQPGTSFNIYDPVANIAAAINYIKSRYGSIFAIDPPVQGYKTGAWDIARDQLARVHKGEMIVPEPTASQVRKGGSVIELGPRSLSAIASMVFELDGEKVTRAVTKRQNYVTTRGIRR